MRKLYFTIPLIIGFVSIAYGAEKKAIVPLKGYSAKQAVDILVEAEKIRSLDKAGVDVDLKTVADEKTTTYVLEILRSTGRRALIAFVAPKEEIGRKMLAKGRRYWSTFPDSKHVHLISKKEMIGNSAFAIADIFQIDPHEDYTPTVVGKDKVKGVSQLHLTLMQKHEDAPYHRIEYWVEEKGYFPVKAAFYGVSGKHLKTMTVQTRKKIAGRLRPFETQMVDEVTEGHKSWWKTTDMVAKDVPDQVFTKSYLRKK
jgi:outer membrane lipoprotein-sorting protein